MSRCQICNYCPDTDGTILLEDGKPNIMVDYDTCRECSGAVDLAMDDFQRVDGASGPVWPSDEATEQIEDWDVPGWLNPETPLLELPGGFHDEDDQETPTLP